MSVAYVFGLQAYRNHSQTLPCMSCRPKGLFHFLPNGMRLFTRGAIEPACLHQILRRVSRKKLRHRSGSAREFPFGFRRQTIRTIDLSGYRSIVRLAAILTLHRITAHGWESFKLRDLRITARQIFSWKYTLRKQERAYSGFSKPVTSSMEGKLEGFLHMIRCSGRGCNCAAKESRGGSASDLAPNQTVATLKRSW